MNTARRPMRSASRPQHGRAEDRANARGQQDDSRLTEAELPRPDNECENEADQEIVKELQHVAEDCCGNDAPLVGGEGTRRFESLEHRVVPPKASILSVSRR